jgi:phospholipid/cholesterol/gamma-HCH transport system ATP-binding protein
MKVILTPVATKGRFGRCGETEGRVGVEVAVEGMTKSFGRQNIWHNVSLTLPAGEISALLGPSGTGKSVFLKCLIGLLRPEGGHCYVDGVDTATASERDLFRARKLFGVLFQDGALFGSLPVFDNVAFPLREHTRKTEAEIRRIVLEKMEMVGLTGAEHKLPDEISGGMRKRAGLARALVLDPQIILCDEPDSGLDPVRTALIAQLLVDLNAQLDATILVVTHDTTLARTLPDNAGLLFNRRLVMFGAREVLLTSREPVIEQFINGRKAGPIGMSEEKDQASLGREREDAATSDSAQDAPDSIPEQIQPSPGLPERSAAVRHRARVLRDFARLPAATQRAMHHSSAHGAQ